MRLNEANLNKTFLITFAKNIMKKFYSSVNIKINKIS